MTVTFTILGTGAGPGVPSYFCDCPACLEARANSALVRTRSGAVIRTGGENILIDASPDLRTQLVRENISSLACVFLTHWHYDHFGGLGDLEFFVRLKRMEPLKLFLPSEALVEFEAAYPFLSDVLEVTAWQFGQEYRFNDFLLTLYPARHSVPTAGLFLKAEQSGKTLAYFPDTAGLPEITQEKVRQADYFICDATFHGANWYPHSHMTFEEAIRLGEEVQARKTILTHLAMHYSTPVTVRELQEKLLDYPQVSLAYDGMTINL
ncbi:MAG TPA: MBL fold metallo-hydrolase [Peptococcaceae bacterium]|nr:MBL fold metallo-hydrolase [Peptococcaceae bacterium]